MLKAAPSAAFRGRSDVEILRKGVDNENVLRNSSCHDRLDSTRASPPSPNCKLSRSPKPYRNELRNTRFLHRNTVQNRGDAHRLLAVCDEHKLCLHAHFFHQLRESTDVGFI